MRFGNEPNRVKVGGHMTFKAKETRESGYRCTLGTNKDQLPCFLVRFLGEGVLDHELTLH